MINLHPTSDNLILKSISAELKTDSGIVLSSKDKFNYNIAKIHAKGPDVSDELNIGDIMVHKKWTVDILRIDDERLIFTNYKDLFAVIDDNSLSDMDKIRISTVIPINEYILVKTIEPSVSSLIIIPTKSKEHQDMAIIQAISKDIDNINCNSGDTIVYSKHSERTFKTHDGEFAFIKYDDIDAVIE